jgi:hypothetical protein
MSRAVPFNCVLLGSTASFRDWETLAERGVALGWVSIRDIARDLHINFLAGQTRVHLGSNAEILSPKARLWYNPGSFSALEDEISGIVDANGAASYEAQQYKAALDFLEFWLDDNYHMLDSPQTQRRSSNKLLQLHSIAKAMPDNLIETELISSPAQLKTGTLIKHVGESRRITEGEAFYAQRLSEGQLSALRDGPLVPLLAQAPISTREEFRTFVFGEQTATIRLPRPAPASSIYDIQFFPDYVAQAVAVDPVVSVGLWEILGASMGLSIFAVDYVMQGVVPKIFEINPVFSWAWLPSACIDAVASAAAMHFAL